MFEGILPLWKETGMTSHDCVFKLRKILKMKRIGHTGTLDPSVEGVLPICLGQATKVAEYITDQGKTYEAVVSIGTATTTEDAEGEIVEQNLTMKSFTRNQILDVFAQLTGDITQTPPMYSAVKVNGKRLYEYARKGQVVERPTRVVHIKSLELLSDEEMFQGEEISFRIRVACGKGTYIRTLAVQIGELLGFPAHMASLIRTSSGSFTKERCVTLEQVRELVENGSLSQHLLPIEYALQDFPYVELHENWVKRVLNGQVLPAHSILSENTRVVFTKNSQPVAVYQVHPTKEGMMKPEKMFQSQEESLS